MEALKIVIVNKKIVGQTFILASLLLVGLSLLMIHIRNNQAEESPVPPGVVIVIDAGHGGVDGGTGKGGLREKDVNLAIAQNLKAVLTQKGYRVVMTRNEDIALDSLDHANATRHQRDLNARVSMINTSSAQLFISIHANYSARNSAADGSIVFYDDKLAQNETLADCIQQALNKIVVDGKSRTAHDPLAGDYYLLNHADIPGVIVETAFISNNKERKLLAEDGFRTQLAQGDGRGSRAVFIPAGLSLLMLGKLLPALAGAGLPVRFHTCETASPFRRAVAKQTPSGDRSPGGSPARLPGRTAQ